jgi:hypothetical protein
MNSALPRPQPARRPTIAPTLFDSPASVLNTTISTSPVSSVRFVPMRLATTLETSIDRPVNAK